MHRLHAHLVIDRLIERSSPAFGCGIRNLMLATRRRAHRFHYDKDKQQWFVSERGRNQYFVSRRQGFTDYGPGLESRASDLARSYRIDRIDFANGDVVIDCGANVGDLSRYFEINNIAVRYIAYEPSPPEADCLRRNAPNGEINEIGLYRETGALDFYISSFGADSSLEPPADGWTEIIKTRCVSLAHEFERLGLERVRLLKLEAEGLEPEILEGAGPVLNRIDYIAVDGGPERGLKAETTIETLSNTLIGNGFEMQAIDLARGWGRALFRNTKAALPEKMARSKLGHSAPA